MIHLHVIATFDVRLLPPLIDCFKRMAACNVQEKKLPQDGRIMLTLKQAPGGLILCTGPLGSGKTTTLYACLQEVSGEGVKILTVEDPVEYTLPWATQVAVSPQHGMTFASVLRAILRADPDVILIGEIRDKDTLQCAVQAVLTGHRVLSSLHTNDAVSALIRQVDIGLSPFLVDDCPQLIIAQRLVRKLCDACAVPCKPTASDIKDAAAWLPKGQKNPVKASSPCRAAVGCPRCALSGYRGRTVITETLVMSREIGRALRAGEPAQRLHEIACNQGMVPMVVNGLMRVAAGETTWSEIRRVVAVDAICRRSDVPQQRN